MLYKRGKCDFPWSYASRCPHADTRFGGGASGDYDLISDQEAMEVWAPWIDSLFHPENAVCFFWIVWPKVEFCLQFIRACGFKPSTLAFDWVKTCKTNQDTFRVNPGAYSGSNSELCILGVRGSMKAYQPLVGQVEETCYPDHLVTVRHGLVYGTDGKPIHSRKPDVFKVKIDQMYPPNLYGNGIGLFERESQGPGWDVFGNQVNGSIPGPSFKQLRIGLM